MSNSFAQTSLSITSDKQKGCKPEVITFTCSGASTGSSYVWIIGKDTNSAKSRFSYTFTSAGIFDVTVRVISPNGILQSFTKKRFIHINESPIIPSISVSRNYLCKKDTATFMMKSKKIAVWDWIIEGVNYNMKSPVISHKFGSYGYQDISLRVKDSFGCTSIKTMDSILFVSEPPSQDFTASKTDGCTPLKTTFLADTTLGTGKISSYTWSFGGASPDNSGKAQTDTITYSKDTTYDVTLTTKTKDGCNYSIVKKKFIRAGTVTKVSFTADTTRGIVGDTFRLTSKFISATAASKGNYDWATGGSIFGSGAKIRTTYIYPGIYSVNLIYTENTCGFKVYRPKYIKVYSSIKDTATTPFYKGCGRVSADFSIPSSGCLGEKITLKVPKSIQAFQCKWHADSAGAMFYPSDTSRSPEISFGYQRNYKITLTTREDTCTADISKNINILQSVLDFTSLDTLTACQPAYVAFYTTSQNVDTFHWDFGDGTSLKTTSSHVGHIYTQNSGDSTQGFTVTVIGKSRYGCSVSRAKQKYVKVIGPHAAFAIVGPHIGVDSIKVNFKDESTNIQNFEFDYGDNSVADSNKILPHTYTLTDSNTIFKTFHPKMVVKNSNGCSMIALSDSVIVYHSPKARFKDTITQACGKWKVQFTNLSRFATRNKWDFNNDGIYDDSTASPVYLYKPGTYSVKLIAFNNSGSDTILYKDIIKVDAALSVKMEVSGSNTCAGSTFVASAKNLNNDVQSLKWIFDSNSNLADTGKRIVHSFAQPGTHIISLVTTSKYGCTDTSARARIYLYDTTVGIKPLINFVSVQGHKILVNWKKLDASQSIRYSLYRDTRLIFQSQNPDDTSFIDIDSVLVNKTIYKYHLAAATMSCGSGSVESSGHSNILLSGYYDSTVGGNRISWNQYKGWKTKEYCIFRALAGGAYQQIAHISGDSSTFFDKKICSENYTYYVMAVSAENPYASLSNTVTIQSGFKGRGPQYVQINYVTVGDDRAIIIEWQPSHVPGVQNYIIDRYTEATGWEEGYAYTKNTIWKDEYAQVMKDAYEYRVRVQDNCGNITLHSNAGRSILLNAKIEGGQVKLDWNKTDATASIGKSYFVQLKTAPNQFMTLPQVSRDTSYIDGSDYSALNGAICYRIMALGEKSPDTSASNISCVILPSRLFIPNAFTPNNDGLNDDFKVNASAMYQLTGNKDIDYHMLIYDRWGIQVFESTDINKGWDGKYGDQPANAGVYTYAIYTVGVDKEHYHVQGTVTLLR